MASYVLGKVAIVNKGNYVSTATYVPLNTVYHRAGTFMCIASCSNVEPGVTTGWNNYWVPTALGIYSTSASISGETVTLTFTCSDGTTASHSYVSTSPPSVEYKISLGGNASSWTKTTDKDGNSLTEVQADSILVVAVDPSSFTVGRNYGVRMSTYGNGTITFVSDTTIPSGTTVYMNVLVVR